MNCPVDGTVLQMAERSGIEIDYCPTCRGVWLDRGELDKLIERGAQQSAPPPAYRGERDRDRRYESDRYEHDHRRPHKKKKGGFLSEVFDFD